MLSLQTSVKVATIAKKLSLTYADVKNLRLRLGKPEIFTPKERVDAALAKQSTVKKRMFNQTKKEACEAFSEIVQEVFAKFSDMPFVQARLLRMSDIVIDASIQRELRLEWAFQIIHNFDPKKIESIKVALDPDNKTRYLAWDGQHTLIALYIIATECYELDPKDVMVPVNISLFETRAEMRDAFISTNGEGKAPLTHTDLYEQRVLGVTTDLSDKDEWVALAEKQMHLQNNGLFLTDEKAVDSDEVGAITNTNIIVNSKMPVGVVKMIAEYLGITTQAIEKKFKADGMQAGRKVDGMELHIIATLFYEVNKESDSVPASFAKDVARLLVNKCNAELFRDGKVKIRVQRSFLAWTLEHRGQDFIDMKKPQAQMKTDGLAFIAKQIRKDLSLRPYVPESMIITDNGYEPKSKDLF